MAYDPNSRPGSTVLVTNGETGTRDASVVIEVGNPQPEAYDPTPGLGSGLPHDINPSTCLTPIFKEISFPGSPPEDCFPLGWISAGDNPPHLKKSFLGGFANLMSGLFFVLCAGKQYVLIVF